MNVNTITTPLQFYDAIQAEDLNDLLPPDEPYDNFLARMPRGRPPQAQDIFDRWDVSRYKCNNRECKAFAESAEFALPGKCVQCSRKLLLIGLAGMGERRAYLGWLCGIMEKAESDQFWMAAVSSRGDALLMLGAVPIIRTLLKEIGKIKGELLTLSAHVAGLKESVQ